MKVEEIMRSSTDIKILLGKRIKELRKRQNLTQEQLAEKMNIDQRNLSKIECGNNFVTSETLSKIVSVLNVEEKELFDFSHNDNKDILKQELLHAITNETIDLNLMYRFYKAIK